MEEIYKQAVALQFKLRDYLDDKDHPFAQELIKSVQRLVDDIEVKKNPRSLEDHTKQLIRLFEEVDGTPVMDASHADDLKDRCEEIRQDLRKLQ